MFARELTAWKLAVIPEHPGMLNTEEPAGPRTHTRPLVDSCTACSTGPSTRQQPLKIEALHKNTKFCLIAQIPSGTFFYISQHISGDEVTSLRSQGQTSSSQVLAVV